MTAVTTATDAVQYRYSATEASDSATAVTSTVLDPFRVLPRLIAILSGVAANEPAAAIVTDVYHDEHGETVGISAAAVAVLQGADGDPELEWDDVAASWAAHPDCQPALADSDADDLADVLEELRALLGGLPSGATVRCTTRAVR